MASVKSTPQEMTISASIWSAVDIAAALHCIDEASGGAVSTHAAAICPDDASVTPALTGQKDTVSEAAQSTARLASDNAITYENFTETLRLESDNADLTSALKEADLYDGVSAGEESVSMSSAALLTSQILHANLADQAEAGTGIAGQVTVKVTMIDLSDPVPAHEDAANTLTACDTTKDTTREATAHRIGKFMRIRNRFRRFFCRIFKALCCCYYVDVVE